MAPAVAAARDPDTCRTMRVTAKTASQYEATEMATPDAPVR